MSEKITFLRKNKAVQWMHFFDLNKIIEFFDKSQPISKH